MTDIDFFKFEKNKAKREVKIESSVFVIIFISAAGFSWPATLLFNN